MTAAVSEAAAETVVAEALVTVSLVSRVAVEAAIRSEQIVGAVWQHSVSLSKSPFELLYKSVSSISPCLVAFSAHFLDFQL